MIDRKTFFDRVRAEPFAGFLSGSQVSGISTILDVAEKRGVADPRHLAYALATTFHETARTMQPIEEYGHGKGRTYGVPAGPWHLVYDGRGDVQLTWIVNYTKATARLKALGFDVDLVQHPEQAMRPDVAAAVLIVGMTEGWFTGASLGHFFDADSDDPVNARRIINGVDCAEMIAGYHRSFLAALKAETAPSIVAVDETKPVLAGIERAINIAGAAQAAERAKPLVVPPIAPGPDPAIKLPTLKPGDAIHISRQLGPPPAGLGALLRFLVTGKA